jgi:DNA-binding PadR family transcriptional regulator
MDVRALCLGVLTLGDATGYEIKKAFEEGPISNFLEASFGSIYPALTRMTEEGLVTCRAFSQAGKPDKKIYSITDDGRETFAQALVDGPPEDKFRSEFLFRMMFVDLLDPQEITNLIDFQINEFRQRAQAVEDELGETTFGGAHFVRGYGRAMVRAAIEYLEENRHHVENKPIKPSHGAAGDRPVRPTLSS